jgi:hypothetical protein
MIKLCGKDSKNNRSWDEEESSRARVAVASDFTAHMQDK